MQSPYWRFEGPSLSPAWAFVVSTRLKLLRIFDNIFSVMFHPQAPTTFEDVIRLVPPRGKIVRHRFVLGDKPFEIEIGTNDSNPVFIDFCAPDGKNEYYPCIRSVGGLMSQRAIWSVWERFLADLDDYLSWKRFEVTASVFRNDRQRIGDD